MNTTTDTITKQLPQFSSTRCKRCGICGHFCPVQVIGTCDGSMPYLVDPVACTSCGLCQDMCPDWAVSLEPTAMETGEIPGNGAGSPEVMTAAGD